MSVRDGRSCRVKHSTILSRVDAGSSGYCSVRPLLGHRSEQDDKKNNSEHYVCHTEPLPQSPWENVMYP